MPTLFIQHHIDVFGVSKAKKMRLNCGNNLILALGKSYSFIPTFMPQNAVETVTYTVSDINIIEIDSSGVLYAVGTGKATLTAKSQFGKNFVCKVYVMNSIEEAIRFKKKSMKGIMQRCENYIRNKLWI